MPDHIPAEAVQVAISEIYDDRGCAMSARFDHLQDKIELVLNGLVLLHGGLKHDMGGFEGNTAGPLTVNCEVCNSASQTDPFWRPRRGRCNGRATQTDNVTGSSSMGTQTTLTLEHVVDNDGVKSTVQLLLAESRGCG